MSRPDDAHARHNDDRARRRQEADRHGPRRSPGMAMKAPSIAGARAAIASRVVAGRRFASGPHTAAPSLIATTPKEDLDGHADRREESALAAGRVPSRSHSAGRVRLTDRYDERDRDRR